MKNPVKSVTYKTNLLNAWSANKRFIYDFYFAARNCPQKCEDKDEPICGTDGNTYKNPCVLDLSACETNKKILMVHTGRCSKYKLYCGDTSAHEHF